MSEFVSGAAGRHVSLALRDLIAEREEEARRLDLPPDDVNALWAAVGPQVLRAAAQRGEAPAYVAGEPAAAEFSIDEAPGAAADVLATLDRVAQLGINQTSGGHFAFIPGGGLFPAALGDLIADVANPYAGVRFAAPAATSMERSLVRWMADLAGYPPTAGGDLTSGASVAHLEGIVTARDAAGVRPADASDTVVYLTSETHHCIEKALRICGLADCIVRQVAVDERRRLRADALDATIRADRRAGLRPWLVVATAGTVDAGAVDPLDAAAAVADEHGAWLHVDAAYGGFFVLTAHGRRVLAGIERSQTVVMDPHKGLFLPFGSGALIVRDERQLAAAHRYSADYLADARGAGEYSASDLSVELSRPFRAPRLWLPLKLFGLAPFRAALEEKLLLARYLHSRLAETPRWVVGPEPDLSVVTFRYLPERGDADEFNRRLLEAVLAEGRTVISGTKLDGVYTLRAGILHYRSHLEHVDALIEVLTREALRLEAS
jgi:glutamate/tyrosine decarboxylase-like PLP-dependent enzyme